MSIQENVLKIKGYGAYLQTMYRGHILGVIFLASMACFLLSIGFYAGYMRSQSLDNREEGIIFIPEGSPTLPCEHYPNIPKVTEKHDVVSDKTPVTPSSVPSQSKNMPFVASQKGKSYYPIACNGARRIKEENRVYFTSTSEAEQRGYTLSKTCK